LLLDIFNTKIPPMFGMDISNSAIKLVELSYSGTRKLKLERYAVEYLGTDVYVDGEIRNQEALSESITRALKKFKSKSKHVVMAFPESIIITRRITLPTDLKGDELASAASSEAQKFIAFPIDEVNVDYQILGLSQKAAGENDVLLATARSDKVGDLVSAAELSGLNAYVIDADALACQVAIGLVAPQNQYFDQNIVYVDIGANQTQITVFRNGENIFHRVQSVGGAQLTASIVSFYDVLEAEAIAIKFGAATVPDNYKESVLVPFMETIAQEVFRAIQMFTTSTMYTETDIFILAGGSASIEGMVQMISDRVSAPVRLANPFIDMDVSGNIDVDMLAQTAPSLLTACGLAMRRFDTVDLSALSVAPSFFPQSETSGQKLGEETVQLDYSLAKPMINLLPYREIRMKEARKQLGIMAGTVAALAAAVVMFVHLGYSTVISQQEGRNDFIKVENVRLDKDIEEINRLNGEIQALISRKQIIESLQSDRAQTIQIMDQMVTNVPDGIYLKSIKQSGLKINVTGYAMSNDLVSAFMTNIGTSPYLENPELVEIKASVVNTKRMNEFNLNFSLKRPKGEIKKTGKEAKSTPVLTNQPAVPAVQSVVAPTAVPATAASTAPSPAVTPATMPVTPKPVNGTVTVPIDVPAKVPAKVPANVPANVPATGASLAAPLIAARAAGVLAAAPTIVDPVADKPTPVLVSSKKE
jgi:type IV pilus assembly protein PilM